MEKSFKYEAHVASHLFGSLMEGKWKDPPCTHWCPEVITLFLERVIEKAWHSGYYAYNAEMEELFFQKRVADTGIRYEGNEDIWNWIQKQIRKEKGEK